MPFVLFYPILPLLERCLRLRYAVAGSNTHYRRAVPRWFMPRYRFVLRFRLPFVAIALLPYLPVLLPAQQGNTTTHHRFWVS